MALIEGFPLLNDRVLGSIHTDSAMDSDSTGGPLLNLYGEVVVFGGFLKGPIHRICHTD